MKKNKRNDKTTKNLETVAHTSNSTKRTETIYSTSHSLKNKKCERKQDKVLKNGKRVVVNSVIFTIVFVCIISIIIVAINSKKSNSTNIGTASVPAEKAEITQKQEEQSNPKALTTITAREPNTDNFIYVTSGDGKQVPVPKGYVASPAEAERYRDGKYETWKKQEDLTFKSATTYYLDQTLTFASPAEETYKWTENSTVGAWQSGNYQVASSTSTIETNTFTIANSGDVVRLVWSVSSQNATNTDYAYYTITNINTSETIGGTSTAIYGTGNGTEEASLIFNNTDVALDVGTYKVTVTYTKDAETDTDLDRTYVKSINVYSESASTANTSIQVNGSYDYAWSYDSTISAWKSGNYNISNSTSTIESNNFTVTEATKVRISWAVCSQTTNDYVYYTITNVDTGATTGGTSTSKSGTGNGTAEASLTYTNTDVNLSAGTYKVELKYVKDYTTNTNLDRAYLKSIKAYTQSATSEDSFTLRVASGGFVIYEKNAGETDEKATTEIADNLDTAQRTRNQWVFIPISTSELNNIYYINKAGIIFAKKLGLWISSGVYFWKAEDNGQEPSLLWKKDVDQLYLKQFLEGISENEFLQEMRENFQNMLESVATYGGFYLGRYETGNINSKNPVVRKGNSNISNVNWYKMYGRCRFISSRNKNVSTEMIWSILFSEVCKWLWDSGEAVNKDISFSEAWGNFRSVSFSYENSNGAVVNKVANQSVKIPTGSTDRNKANNIYDLAGNVAEWTLARGYDMEDVRIVRGGWLEQDCYNFRLMSEATTPNYRRMRANEAFASVGCRAILTINCQK